MPSVNAPHAPPASLSVDQDIVNKDNGELIQVVMKDSIHRVHKDGWSVS